MPFGRASNLSWFVKVCASSFCPTPAVPLLLTCLLGAAVSLQHCRPPGQEPSLCPLCHQERDLCITENLIANCVVCAEVLNHNMPTLLLHQEQQGEQRGAVPFCIPLAALSLGDACLAVWAVSSLCPCVFFTAETEVSSSLAKMTFET